MDRHSFHQRIKENILILDGAMGTMLQPHLSDETPCGDLANIIIPDIVIQVHRKYVEAGADIILTNTFGANRIKLREHQVEEKLKEINNAGVRLAKEAANENAWVAGSIGPSGKFALPIGELSFENIYETFKEQAVVLADAGADLIIMETFSDLKEAKIALLAVRENVDIPVMISMTFEENFQTTLGTDPATAANVLSSLGADAVGVNCTMGPEPMLEVLGRMVLTTHLPTFIEPNAKVYKSSNAQEEYLYSPEEMAQFGEKFFEIGANIIGTCCGSNPDHTSSLSKKLKDKKPVIRFTQPVLRLSSRYQTIEIGSDLPFSIIGERINPTNRKELEQEIVDGKISLIQKESEEQQTEGAHIIDVNIGVPNIDEPEMMRKIIHGIDATLKLPLSIDSTNPDTIEIALKETAGKVLINSVTGKEDSLKHIIPLAARYGAGLICLAIDDEGIPKSAEERIQILKKIVKIAEEAGINKENLICDCLTLTVSAQQRRAQETLKAIKIVKEELGLPTILGVSNISFGLPNRSIINSTFLGMAMAAGLDAAIMNPRDSRMMETVHAASVITLRDKNSKEYVKIFGQKKFSQPLKEKVLSKESEEIKILQALLSGNKDEIALLVKKFLADGKTALEINDKFLIPSIEEVGKKYECKEIYLPQMILAAETFQSAFGLLEPHFSSSDISSKGTILICTVKGDVHDIGKNIVSLFLRIHGLNVIDIGKNISAEEILEKSIEFNADVVGLSALMTTTMTEMPKVIELFRKSSSKAKIIIGGAVVTKKYANQIGADSYAKDGISAVEQIRNLLANL